MAKARITLTDTGPLTYTGAGYENIQRGQAIITSKDEDIVHFSSQPGFAVEMLSGEKPKAAPVVDEDDEEEETSGGEGGDDDADGPVDGELTEAELMKLNKGPLLELATERGVKADNSMKKDQIVAAILAKKD